MLFINNTNTNPYFNLALEEYLIKNFNEDFFMLWRDTPCIVIGKNQNALSEINISYVNKDNIPVIRRLSGGGAVFHDLGNVNFTFISNESRYTNDFKKFTQPIIDVLSKLGINSEFSGRNDIIIDGKKISGNAQYIYKERTLHHGTLLFSSKKSNISKYLNPKSSKFEGKNVASVESRVTNIKSHLKKSLEINEFINIILNHVLYIENVQEYKLTDTDIKNINNLVEKKYSTWEWNFGQSPRYNFKKDIKHTGGIIEIFIFAEKGIIKEIRINGDFFSKNDITDLENLLVGVRHERESIINTLSSLNINDYFLNITLGEVVESMF